MREFPWILLSIIEVVVGDSAIVHLVLQRLIMRDRICGRFQFFTVIHYLTIVQAFYQIFVLDYFFEIQRLLLHSNRLFRLRGSPRPLWVSKIIAQSSRGRLFFWFLESSGEFFVDELISLLLFLFNLFGNFRILPNNNLLLNFHSGPIQFFCVFPLLIHINEGHKLFELIWPLFLLVFWVFVNTKSDGLLPIILIILLIVLRVVLVLYGFLQNRLLLRWIQISPFLSSWRWNVWMCS